MAALDQAEGFWGARTSNVDWCAARSAAAHSSVFCCQPSPPLTLCEHHFLWAGSASDGCGPGQVTQLEFKLSGQVRAQLRVDAVRGGALNTLSSVPIAAIAAYGAPRDTASVRGTL